MELRRPRAFGNCWLGCELWRQLRLEEFWEEKLAEKVQRETVSWAKVLQLLVVNRLIDPGSEFRVHRQWFDQSAMAELMQTDFAVAEKDRLYRCLDRLLEHKAALFQHLRERWQDLFQAQFDVLLYDLTSTLHRRPRGRDSQSSIRLQPRSALRLQTGGDRAGDHAGGLSAGLRSDGGQHRGPHMTNFAAS